MNLSSIGSASSVTSGFLSEPPLSPGPAPVPTPAPIPQLRTVDSTPAAESLSGSEPPAPVTPPVPAPASAPAPAPVQAAPRTDVGARVLVRLENGERIEVGAFDGFEAAKKRARELMAELGQAAEWPFLSGRYVRPEAIVSIDIDLTG